MKMLNNLQLKPGDIVEFNTDNSVLSGRITDTSDRSLISLELDSGKVIKVGRKSIIRRLMCLDP